MIPAHVADVTDAYFLLRDWLDGLGGHVLDEPILLDLLVDAEGDPVGIKLKSTRIVLGPSTLTISLNVDSDLEVSFYRFDLRRTGADLVTWRHDRHVGHPGDGTEHHIHFVRNGVETREAVHEPPSLRDLSMKIAETAYA